VPYGTNKIEAEKTLAERVPDAYTLRPPYLYGPMQNVYREPFVFDCALAGRKFYIPKDGKMKLQFFHVEDLCRIIEKIWEMQPKEHIFNLGNECAVDIHTFVSLCYQAVGRPLETVNVYHHKNQRDYFCFHDYEYMLDVTRQKRLLPKTKDLAEGLQESFRWYINHREDVIRKNYMDFIDTHLK
jgi:nucleoside-diphosphate-sugar epimerase